MRSGDLLTGYLRNENKLEPPKQSSDHGNGPQAIQGAHGTLCSRVNTAFIEVTKRIEIQDGGELRNRTKFGCLQGEPGAAKELRAAPGQLSRYGHWLALS